MMFPFMNYLPNNYYRKYNRPYIPKQLSTEPVIEDVVISETRKKDDKNPVFEIFGISLELDDLLILGLLFFLYMENVDDYGLYMVLVLLLLS